MGAAHFVPLIVGRKAHYSVEPWKDFFYVQTDEGAPRGRVYKVDPAHKERDAWREIVSESAEATLEDASILGGKLALRYLRNASTALELFDLEGKPVRKIPLLGLVTGAIVGRPDEDEAYLQYESFTAPLAIDSYSISTGRSAPFARIRVAFNPEPYLATQVFYRSKDQTRVSMFIVSRKESVRDGKARVLLYGYGGFQAKETPHFVASSIPWLERGGVYAIANLRGGSEYGEDWHTGGMLEKKQNVFDDFIGAAEFLIQHGYTRPGRLAIFGASNGGLLTGAALTQRPDLFGAVVSGVPLLDMVRYQLFGSGKTWISEYGSAADPLQFRALLAYSPYHHVHSSVRYPPTLVLSADSDDRVDPMHARKFIARLQNEAEGGPFFLRIEKHSGHAGADLIKAEVEKSADRVAFLLAHTQ